MSTHSKWSRLAPMALAFGVLLSFGGWRAAAQAENRADDPEYGSVYGRVRYLDGSMVLQRTADGEVVDATVNDPVAPGDRLTTEDGRAEIALSDGSTVWVDRGTRLDVRNLADIENRYESTNLLALETGAIRIESQEPESKSRTFRVDTEAGSIYLLSGGSFRIENDGGVTTLYSFRGVAELSGDDGSVLVRSGERSGVQAGRAPAEPRRFNTARLDDFDRFCESREDTYLRRDGARVDDVADEVPYEVHPYVNELSHYGSWHRMPDYGWVWRPVYSGSWGPYANGYWSWCRNNWVWVSSDPWGWAPYHYGRWDFVGDYGWIWIPGRVWSGAWVSFAVGTSHIGWCPLNYYNRPVFQDTTIINIVNVNVNRLQPRGWRYVSMDQFSNPRAPRGIVRVDRLPRGTDVVLTSRLPRFNPRDVAARPERGARLVETVRQTRRPLPAAVDRDNKPLSFRTSERVAQPPRAARRGDQGRPVTQPAPRVRPDAPPGVPTGPRTAPPRSGGTILPRARPERVPAQGGRQQAAPPGAPAGANRPRGSAPGAPGQRVAPRDQGQGRGNAALPSRPQESSRDQRSRPAPQNSGRVPDQTPRREAPRTEPRRPGASDQAIERLFDGVRGERGRPRVEAQRVAPQSPPRPEVKPPRVERPAPERPPAPRPQPKPKDGDDKGRGH